MRYLAAKRTASSLNAGIAMRGLKISSASMSPTMVEQVLVVGHRVQAVEGVRYVDEAALALDLGDRLGQRQPARDQLLDEQADHLALLGRLDLLGDDHLDAVLGRLGLRVERSRDLVVIRDGDRAEPAVAGGGEQHLDRRRAVVRVVGVHVQVDVDQLTLRQQLAQDRVRRLVVAAGHQLRVDVLVLVRDAAPGELGAQRRTRRAQALAQLGFTDEALELRGEHVDVTGFEQQARARLVEQFLVGAETGRDGNGPGAESAHDKAGSRRLPVGGRDDDVRTRQDLVLTRLTGRYDTNAFT